MGALTGCDLGRDRTDGDESRPSMRAPVSRMFQRTAAAWTSLEGGRDLFLLELRLAVGRAERSHHLRLDGIRPALWQSRQRAGAASRSRASTISSTLSLPRRDRGRRSRLRLWRPSRRTDDRLDHRLEAGVASMTAPSMTSSESSLASDSTIITRHSQREYRRRRIRACSRSLRRAGFSTYYAVDVADAGAADQAHERARRRAIRAAEAATMATMSGAFSRSWERTVTIT